MRDEAKQGDGESGSRPDVIDRPAILASHVDLVYNSVETSDDFHVRRRKANPFILSLFKIRQAFYGDYLIDYAENGDAIRSLISPSSRELSSII